MRTTLTLDDDVAVKVEEARERHGMTFKDVVNEALRLGLRVLEAPPEPGARYETPSSSLGGCRLPDLDDVSEALALGEGEGFR